MNIPTMDMASNLYYDRKNEAVGLMIDSGTV